MADPSTHPAVKSRHVRKSTLVIPALPLGFPNKKSNRLSQPFTPDTVAQARTATTNREAEVASQPAPPSQTSPSPPTSGQEGARSVPGSAAHETAHVNGLDEAQSLEPDEARQNGSVSEQEHLDIAEIAALAEDKEADPALDHPATGLQDATEPLQADAGTQADTDLDTATVTGDRRVKVADYETQSSEQEDSDPQPSSATGLTDYAGSIAESNLETVVNEYPPPRRLSAMPHRKSEIAPEVLTNGFSPPPAHDSHISHVVNGSVSSQPPTHLEPPILYTMQEHLLYLASSKSFCDTVIQVNQVAYPPSQHYAHSLILSRSEFMAKLLPEPDTTTQTRVINLHPARNVMPHAFEAALRFFYSDQVLTAQALVPNFRDRQTKAHTFEYVMSYWMAGVELELPPIKARSYEVLKELTDWDVVELAAKETQDLRVRAEVLTDGHLQDEVRKVVTMLSHMVSQLIVERVKSGDFNLDVNPKATALPTRFTQLEFNRSNNPALTSMVFGSLQSDAAPAPSTTAVASALMLNMDFADLAILADTLAAHDPRHGANIIRHVVQQREERRAHVISNKSIPNKQRLGDSEKWDAAGWREFVNDVGQLECERVGYLLPTRSR